MLITITNDGKSVLLLMLVYLLLRFLWRERGQEMKKRKYEWIFTGLIACVLIEWVAIELNADHQICLFDHQF